MANPAANVINTVRVSGTDYKFDYPALGNRPNLTVISSTKDAFTGNLGVSGTLTLGSTALTEAQLAGLLERLN